MSTILAQLTSGTKSNLEAQQAINADLGVKVAECLEEFTKLNADAVKASMADSATAVENIFQAENPQQFAVYGASYIKQEMQSAVFYWRELMRIAFTTRMAVNKAGAEWFTESSQQSAQVLTKWVKTAPVDTERMLDTIKSAWESAGNGSAKGVADGVGDRAFATRNQASRKKNENRSTGKTTH